MILLLSSDVLSGASLERGGGEGGDEGGVCRFGCWEDEGELGLEEEKVRCCFSLLLAPS